MNMYNVNLTSVPTFAATVVNNRYLFTNDAKKFLLSEKNTMSVY